MIQWEKRYATGDESVDKQHQMLFEFFNEFEDCVKQGKGKEFLKETFPLLESYAAAHFKYEEQCMQVHHCPAADENKAAHQTFVLKLDEIKKKYQTGQYDDETIAQVHHFVEDWITQHIIGLDTQLRACIKKEMPCP